MRGTAGGGKGVGGWREEGKGADASRGRADGGNGAAVAASSDGGGRRPRESFTRRSRDRPHPPGTPL